MFLCDKCHNPGNHTVMYRSRGRCESCERIRDCIDCYYIQCRPLKTKRFVKKPRRR